LNASTSLHPQALITLDPRAAVTTALEAPPV
jgi:hypothetical protein